MTGSLRSYTPKQLVTEEKTYRSNITSGPPSTMLLYCIKYAARFFIEHSSRLRIKLQCLPWYSVLSLSNHFWWELNTLQLLVTIYSSWMSTSLYNLLMFNYLGSPRFNHIVFCGAVKFLAGIWVLFCCYRLVLRFFFFWFPGEFSVAHVFFLMIYSIFSL